jgi:hypothetical protein
MMNFKELYTHVDLGDFTTAEINELNEHLQLVLPSPLPAEIN